MTKARTRNENIILMVTSIVLSMVWYGLLCTAETCSLFLLSEEFMPEDVIYNLNQFEWYNVPIFLALTSMVIYIYFYTSRKWNMKWYGYAAYSLVWPGIGVFVYIMTLAIIKRGFIWIGDFSWLKSVYELPMGLVVDAGWQVGVGLFIVISALSVINRMSNAVNADNGGLE